MVATRNVDSIAAELGDLINAKLPDVHCATVGTSQQRCGTGVELRLAGASPCPEPRTHDRLTTTLQLDFLITVTDPDVATEQRLYGELMFALLEVPEVTLVGHPAALDTCQALGLPAAAAVLVRIELGRDRVLGKAPLVRFPLVAEVGPVAELQGVVVGAGNLPVEGAVVTLANSDRVAITGADGAFRFAVPSRASGKATIRARSLTLTANLSAGTRSIISLPLEV